VILKVQQSVEYSGEKEEAEEKELYESEDSAGEEFDPYAEFDMGYSVKAKPVLKKRPQPHHPPEGQQGPTKVLVQEERKQDVSCQDHHSKGPAK
jgi:hypothetical protein